MQVKKDKKVVILATGGTIAGVAGNISKPHQYASGQLSVNQLTKSLDTRGVQLVQEQVCNIDSKDMQFRHWQALLERCHFWLNQNEVTGLIVTHGTDTLEETAFFLQTVLQSSKPIAMTCAMFPANVPQSDGPQNLQDALDWVLKTQENGVHLVCAGEVHDAVGVQKIFSDRSHAFASRQESSLQNDTYESKIDWPMPSVAQVLLTKHYPRVELIYNHSGADGQLVKTLLDAKKSAMSEANMESKQTSMTQGLVIAGTGSGTISQDLLKALEEAQKLGLWVARTSRCAYGVSDPDKHPSIPSLHNLSPVQGRVAMILALIAHAA